MYDTPRDMLLLLGGILFFLILSITLKKRSLLSPFAARKLLHTGAIGICALAPQTSLSHTWLLMVVLPVSLILFWLVRRHRFMAVPGMHSGYGIALFTLPFMWMLWTETDADIISLSLGILAISDSAAALAGRISSLKTDGISASDQKTITGSLVFFMSTFLILIPYALILPNPNSYNSILALIALAVGTTAAEALTKNGWDNVSIPLFVLFFLPFYIESSFQNAFILITVVSGIFMFFSTRKQLLNPEGAFAASVIGAYTALSMGGEWLLPLVVFFGSSVIIGRTFPHHIRSDTKTGKARDHVQVWSNGGVFILCVVLHTSEYLKKDTAMLLMLVSIAIATADTWSSEIGMYFKGKTYHALTWSALKPGISGGISLQGSLAAAAGALLIASLAGFFMEEFKAFDFLVIFLAGVLGMYLDSILGAGLQAKYSDESGEIGDDGTRLISGYSGINNDRVNLLSNALTVGMVYVILQIL